MTMFITNCCITFFEDSSFITVVARFKSDMWNVSNECTSEGKKWFSWNSLKVNDKKSNTFSSDSNLANSDKLTICRTIILTAIILFHFFHKQLFYWDIFKNIHLNHCKLWHLWYQADIWENVMGN